MPTSVDPPSAPQQIYCMDRYVGSTPSKTAVDGKVVEIEMLCRYISRQLPKTSVRVTTGNMVYNMHCGIEHAKLHSFVVV